MSKIICPVCNSEVILPKTSEFVMGMSVSEQSKGDYVLPMKNNSTTNVNNNSNNTKERKIMTKTEARMEALRAAGADMNRYFKIALPTGGDMLMEMVDGVPTPVLFDVTTEASSDSMVEQIISDNYVRNSKLHRRFVLAQMWDMINYNNKYTGGKGYEDALRDKGYMYQWEMMLEEVHVLAKLEARDKETFEQRVHFFNQFVVIDCAIDYIDKLEGKVKTLKEKHCKGIPYKTVYGKDYFVEDLQTKYFAPFRSCINRMKMAENYTQLERGLRRFVKMVKHNRLDYKTPFANAFKDAYKGAGSYYSLRNLIQFHNCALYVSQYEVLKGTKAIEYIESKLDEYESEGYRYFAMLKKCIKDNQWVPTWK